MDYVNLHLRNRFKNKANTKPIKPNSRKAKMKLSFYSTKDYENKPRLRTPGKQTQSNPIFTLPILTTLVRRLVRRSFSEVGSLGEVGWRRRIQKGYLTALRSVVLRSIPYGITEDKY